MTSKLRRILIVDDYTSGREACVEYFQFSGFATLTAEDGEEAVDTARRELPDLILMDLSLPKLSGWEATRILKEDAATLHIPIIVVTAHALKSELKRAREVGCDDVITKPAHPRTLVERVSQILGGGRISAEEDDR